MNRLFPLLTIITVLVLALLPQKISLWKDQTLQGSVQTELLVAENDLPVRSPSLSERMELLAQWMTAEDITSTQTELTGESYEMWINAILLELEDFQSNGLFPAELLPTDITNASCYRMYLRRQLQGAEYIVMDTYLKSEGIHLWVVLDEETGHLLWLELGNYSVMKALYEKLSPLEIGCFFLYRLGIVPQTRSSDSFYAVLEVPDAIVDYSVSLDSSYVIVRPMVPEAGTSVSSDAE